MNILKQLTTLKLVRVVAAIVFAVTVVSASDTLEVLAVELKVSAVLVHRVTVLAFVCAVSTVVVMVTRPTLQATTLLQHYSLPSISKKKTSLRFYSTIALMHEQSMAFLLNKVETQRPL